MRSISGHANPSFRTSWRSLGLGALTLSLTAGGVACGGSTTAPSLGGALKDDAGTTPVDSGGAPSPRWPTPA
jgi:hypothetical protein